MSTKRKYTWQENLLYGGTMSIVCSVVIIALLYVYAIIESVLWTI